MLNINGCEGDVLSKINLLFLSRLQLFVPNARGPNKSTVKWIPVFCEWCKLPLKFSLTLSSSWHWMTGFKQNATVLGFQSSAGSVPQWLEPTNIEEQEISWWLMLHSDYAKTSVMFFSLLLNTLSSVVQLIKRREQGGSRYKEIITDGFGSACFSTSLSVHIHYLWLPPLPAPPLPCYLFGHVARLSSLETYARLSICFLKTLFKK